MLTTKRNYDTVGVKTVSSVLITYDVPTKRIRLYSPDKTFDLVEFISQNKVKDVDGVICTVNWAIDQDGNKVKTYLFSSGSGIVGFNIVYDDVTYSYFAEPLPN